MLIIWFPIRRLRMTSIISQVNRNRNKHIFRSVMMWLQLSISIFFIGGTFVINLGWYEAFGRTYSALTSQEEKEIIIVKINT